MHAIFLIISDILSVATISLCLILKVPQIIRLFKAKSGVGLSLNALLLELSSYTVTMMYNYTNNHALLSYLEYPILLFQEYIIIALLCHYTNCKPSTFLIILAVYGSVTLGFAYGLLSKVILTLLVPLTTPVGGLSKVMQLIEIIRRKNADSVSALTWFLSVFTNVTRIYTVYVDSADSNLLLNFTISSFLSSAVLLTALYYQRASRIAAEGKQS